MRPENENRRYFEERGFQDDDDASSRQDESGVVKNKVNIKQQ